MFKRKFKEGSDFANLVPIKERESFIDIAKIIAILLMIITHVVAITYNFNSGTDTIVYYVGMIGGIGSFTSFLLLSGVNYYYSAIKEFTKSNSEDYTKLLKKLFYRVLQIGVIYCLLAFAYVFIFSRIYASPSASESILRNFYNLLTIGPLPEFSEYLIPTAIFIFGGLLFGNVYKWISLSPLRALLSGTVLYFVGYIAFNIVDLPARLNVTSSVLWGKTFDGLRIHSFPIFQYALVFFLGLWLGHFFKSYLHTKVRVKTLFVLVAASLGLTLVFVFANGIKPLDLFYPLPNEGRFPPSLGFISLSLSIAFTSVLVAIFIAKLLKGKFSRILSLVAKNSLGILFWHLLVLFAYQYLFDTERINFKANNILEILGVYAIVLAISLALTFLYNVIFYGFIGRRLQSEIYFFIHTLLPLIVLVVTLFASIYLVFNRVTAYARTLPDSVDNFNKVISLPKQDPFWANDDFKFKRQISIENTSSDILVETNYIGITFDHAKAISEKKALEVDGKDLRLIYWNRDTNVFEEVPISILNPNNQATKITFKLKHDIEPGEINKNYFLYYGNVFASVGEKLSIPDNLVPLTDGVTLEEEMTHRLNIAINKEWLLLKPDTKQLMDILGSDIDLPAGIVSGKYYISYDILDANNKILLEKEIPLQDSTRYAIVPEISNLEPAIYKLQAKLINFDKNLEVLTTYKIPFRISYPLYVTWTIDWDGWDASNGDIFGMNALSNQYGMPMVQLFNPRIYVEDQFSANSFITKVSPERAAYLTQWVRQRQHDNGDEIGLHLHMFADMLKEIGVDPRPGTVIGAMYGDAKTSDFTYDELDKIFKWALEKFEEHDLPAPVSYRAGGWFGSLNMLNALINNGFLIDTTGRTGGRINPTQSYSTEVPWSLQTTTHPYKPSTTDMNKWEGNRLDIWEFPNNGADSYWFSGEEMISRFQQNMPGTEGVLGRPQVLTYLTHPHWFKYTDEAKLKILFEYMSKFKYQDNAGPVIFTTLEKAYRDWNDSDINGN